MRSSLVATLLFFIVTVAAHAAELPELGFTGMDDPRLQQIAAATMDEYGYIMYEDRHSHQEWVGYLAQAEAVFSETNSEFALYLISGLAGTLSQEAHDEFGKREQEAAHKLYELAPAKANALAEFAAALTDLDEKEAAGQQMADAALALDPDNISALHTRAMLYSKNSDFEQAITLLKHVTELAPNSAYLWSELGDVYWYADMYAEAVPAYDRTVALDPRDDNSLTLRGRCHYELDEYDQAEVSFRAALAVDSRNALAHLGLARTLYAKDQHKLALPELDLALSADESLSLAHNLRGLILGGKQGNYEAALREFKRALELDPEDAVFRRNYADCYMNIGKKHYDNRNLPLALENFDKGLAIDPSYPNLYNRRAMTLKKLGRLDEALKEYVKTLTLDPNDHAYRYNYGLALKQAGRRDEAEQEFRISAKLNPSDPDPLWELALLLIDRAERKGAKELLEKILKINPRYTDAKNKLAELD